MKNAAAVALERKQKTKQGRVRPAAGRRNRVVVEAQALFRTALLYAVILAALGLTLVFINAQTASFQYEKAQLRQSIALKKELIQEQKSEIAVLSNPERIRKIASEKLGMITPEKYVYVVIEPEKKQEEVITRTSKASFAQIEQPGLR